ncbi:hypothetical protein [Entomobacter blattae]|uniref:Uncharacterized protein n=1 Tax=Entomobacter blattae TaxID=2762277 RepID=A0A7H1NPW2_9PROT|nr:hypothetical protein [Entomobacter blattae]QNT77822.1 hypothetical protein JGUZn3_05770 [Entomobacter blattae]
MTPEDARAHNRSHGFINRNISQAILKDIVQSDGTPPEYFSALNIGIDLNFLHHKYWEIKKTIPEMSNRNLPFYLMIKEKYKDFEWQKSVNGIITNYTYMGLKPSLLSLLMGRVPNKSDVDDPLDQLPNGFSAEIRKVFKEIGIVWPDKAGLLNFVTWIQKGISGESLTIVSPVCPDYETELTEESSSLANINQTILRATRHRFTFEGLGEGIGVTAAHLFKAIPRFHKLLKDRLGLNISYIVAPGDFEGFSEETCKRLHIDQTTFLSKIQAQTRAIKSKSPVPVESIPFTNLCGGRENWLSIWNEFLNRIIKGDLCNISSQDWVLKTAIARRDLYNRWYNCINQTNDFYVNLVIKQAAEYAAMGKIITSNDSINNPLILGADDHKMGRFYSLTLNIPVVYLKRIYD